MRGYRGLNPEAFQGSKEREQWTIVHESLRELYDGFGKVQQSKVPSTGSTATIGVTNHHLLGNLTDGDDHTQYATMLGRTNLASPAQIIYGAHAARTSYVGYPDAYGAWCGLSLVGSPPNTYTGGRESVRIANIFEFRANDDTTHDQHTGQLNIGPRIIEVPIDTSATVPSLSICSGPYGWVTSGFTIIPFGRLGEIFSTASSASTLYSNTGILNIQSGAYTHPGNGIIELRARTTKLFGADYATTSPTLQVGQNTGQTANLTEWLASNMTTVLAYVDKDGKYHGDGSALTGISTLPAVTRGAILTGQGATPAWAALTIGTAGKVLVSNGTDTNWNWPSFKDTLFALYNDTDATKLAWFDLSAITHATTRQYTLPDASGTVALTSNLGTIASQAANSVAITGGSITGITDLAVADGGTGASNAATACANLHAPYIAATVNLTAQSGSTSGVTLLASAPTGQYRVSVYLYTNNIGTAGTCSFGLAWADDVGTQSRVVPLVKSGALNTMGSTISLSTNDFGEASFTFYHASGDITYGDTVTGALGAPTYNLRVRLEYLG